MDILKAKRPCACMCRSGMNIDGLVALSGRASRSDSFVLLVRNEEILVPRFLPAFVNASIRKSEGILRSQSLQKEVLLFIAGTMNIAGAIRAAGIRSNGRFIVMASGEAEMREFVQRSGSKVIKEYELGLDLDVAPVVAAIGAGQES